MTATTLTRTTRPQFVQQFPAFAGMSTLAIREALTAQYGGVEQANLTLPSFGWRLPTGEAKAKRAAAIAAHAERKAVVAQAWAELSAL